MKTVLVFLCLTTTCLAGTKTTTYYNRNGSVQFRATERGSQIRTTDSRGCYSGSYQRSGNSVRQTSPGFQQARPNSTFIRRK